VLDGATVGCSVGTGVGIGVGVLVGSTVGRSVGTGVGIGVGVLVGAAVGEDVTVGPTEGCFEATGPTVGRSVATGLTVGRFVGGRVIGIIVGGADTGGVVEGADDCAPARGSPPRSVSNSENASAWDKNKLILRRLEEHFFPFGSSSSPRIVKLEDASELGCSTKPGLEHHFIRNSGLCGNPGSCVNETMQLLQPDNLEHSSDWFASSALPVYSPSFIVCLWIVDYRYAVQ
jgi:hypothetical protein